jgi:Flp pilus assembly protein TadG
MNTVAFRRGRPDRRAQRGQVLVIFALALIAIVAMTGLVIDGGSTFVQRRDQQNVADAAAMAAGYSYSMTGSTAAAATAGQAVATANGYATGTGGVSVSITNAAGNPGWFFTAVVSKPHANNFSGLLGMPSWGVTTTATIITGRPNASLGAMPIIFNEDAFKANGGPSNPKTYSEPDSGSEDVPLGTDRFNWTMYCDDCNANTSDVGALIEAGGLGVQADVSWKLSPLNAGSHAELYSDMAAKLGSEFPVPIVDNNGDMVGWAMFHITGSIGGSDKTLSGYFVTPVNHSSMKIVQNGQDGCDCGDWAVYLTN